ncbi:MAG: peptidoglycan DD-metalloendopeptidase family protein [Anaerolineales bacterium]|nr:peptidoglycan DD-metalloendopeptidase family protein [Anaerolineales bacterium]
MKKSKGVFRIPYQNGTVVKISGDHKTHKPKGRIDMSGILGSQPYRIVAAADGHIRFIVDKFSKQVDSSSGDPCTNNYVWIEHAHGEWTKYSHLRKNSVTKMAKLKVGQFVKAGTFLGFEGKVGCASGSHLHFEVGVPKATNPITTTGGFLKDNADSKRNRIPRICGIPNQVFVKGESYTAKNVPGNIAPGFKEVARHGLPAKNYQCLFDQAVNSNYELKWIDVFDHKGEVFFNVIFRPQGKAKWAAFHGLTAAAYQKKFTKFTDKGYRPIQVESYRSGNEVRYAVIFKKNAGPKFTAYHGFSGSKHQKRFDELTKKGWAPRNISVVSIAGSRKYTALYEKTNVGSFVAKSSMTPAEYQKQFDKNLEASRQVAYLNAHDHNGAPFLTAIWNSKTKGTFIARHNLSSSKYQKEWEKATSDGFLTRYVTGYRSGSSVKYAAVWRK